ncbi:sepiapterin reductase [Zootermopsis nevadensis]|uniref:Sepiapterin reductase n=1 Tax=Zootermopsis nevadensis TaxID=136037 RepID=A0A067R0Z0_ZOONE|nr:sepiapterin reductase [Zootermopsis nevadensis]XP_021925249.1 sepiapterin reductase [Zootermopsis nevadensis]XP_021925250.1 sepiapterin reductase [Zootermopsis nevadensis]XP_021925251.1 sepiapterin reductase [Zootermopsis nevadensis]KDR16573.1 Sepiapterin reductase [Zootermopsis nevadensis]
MTDIQKFFWGQKTYCLITGASKGIGRKFAVEFARRFAANSLLVLVARSESGLVETKDLVKNANADVKVKVYPTDLCKPDPELFLQMIQTSLTESGCNPADFDLSLIIHNAGSVGDVSENTSNMSNPDKWQEYFSLNLFSVACLNSQFLKVFSEGSVKQRSVINVTSLCAIKPFNSMGYYCTGKASREMFFRVLAKENPTLTVLNYAPGPVDTDMVSEVISGTGDADIKQMFVNLKKEEKILTVEQTTNRIIEVLENGKFESGQHVDYYDE